MAMASLCQILSATLIIQPNRLQFFYYENINLTCSGPSSGLTVMRNSTKSRQKCNDFGELNKASCLIKDLYPSDTGVYWCQSGNECSNNISIAVRAGVILESPALPVTEGEEVTLKCSHSTRDGPPTSDFNATFFKDGVFIGTEPRRQKILKSVTKSDEAFYKCIHPKYGESPESHLNVVTPPSERPVVLTVVGPTTHAAGPPFMSLTTLLCIVLVLVLYTAIIAVCVYAYRKYTRARAERRIYEHLTMG